LSEFETKYHGFTIDYNETCNHWRVESFERNYQSLTKAKEAIDRVIRQRGKIEPIPVILCSYYEGDYSRSEITSFISERKVWVRERGGIGRGKTVEISEYRPLYQEIPENWERIQKIEALKKEIKNLQKLQDDEEKKLLPLNTAELYKKVAKEEGFMEGGEQ